MGENRGVFDREKGFLNYEALFALIKDGGKMLATDLWFHTSRTVGAERRKEEAEKIAKDIAWEAQKEGSFDIKVREREEHFSITFKKFDVDVYIYFVSEQAREAENEDE